MVRCGKPARGSGTSTACDGRSSWTMRRDLVVRHDASQSLGGEDSAERAALWARNSIYFRIAVVGTSWPRVTHAVAREVLVAFTEGVGNPTRGLMRARGLVAGLRRGLLRREPR
jgi:hypothetical protein